MSKVGRNDPCPCGSGKKFKKCCDGKFIEVRKQVRQPTPLQKKKMEFKPGFNQEKVNAYHEAGHAVVAALAGPGTEVSTIDGDKVKELTGHTRVGFTNFLGGGKVMLGIDTYLSLALSGITSEAMYATNGTIWAEEDDIVFANEILDNAGYQGELRRLKFVDARLKTEELIKKYEKEIQLVGDALYKRKTLNADDIRELLGSNGLSQEELRQQETNKHN